MNSPNSKDAARSNPAFDNAPLWARERARPAPGEPGSLPVEKWLDKIATQASRESLDAETIAETDANTRSASSRFWALSAAFWVLCGVVGLLLGTTVFTYTRQIVNEATSPPPAAQLITADSDNDLSQTTGTVAAAASDEPTSKPAEAARAQEAAPPTSAPTLPSSPVASAQAPAAPDDLTSQPTKMPRDQADAPPDSGPQAQPSQVPGVQASTAPVPAAPEVTAPPLEPKLPPSSADSTQIAVGQDRPQQRSASEVASPPAVEASAHGESQGPPLQERSTARRLNSDEITALVGRGGDFLKNGDFSAARILLHRAAESGSADAALMLGKTFDPLFLHEIGAIGIKPDVAQCRQWYQKAIELGSEAAAQRLANLAQTGQ